MWTEEPEPPPAASGATAGTPGSWTPSGSTPPASVGTIGSVTASPATAWTVGQYVQTGTAGVPGEASWNGTGWVERPRARRRGVSDERA